VSDDAAWLNYKRVAKATGDKKADFYGPQTGNWTEQPCDAPGIEFNTKLNPRDRWRMLDGDHAWANAIKEWEELNKGDMTFSTSIFNTFNGPPISGCETVLIAGWDTPVQCHIGKQSGAVGFEVLNSLIFIHQVCHPSVILSSVGVPQRKIAYSRCPNRLSKTTTAQSLRPVVFLLVGLAL